MRYHHKYLQDTVPTSLKKYNQRERSRGASASIIYMHHKVICIAETADTLFSS